MDLARPGQDQIARISPNVMGFEILKSAAKIAITGKAGNGEKNIDNPHHHGIKHSSGQTGSNPYGYGKQNTEKPRKKGDEHNIPWNREPIK